MEIIAKIYNDYTSKFGIPRQAGIVNEVISTIVFEPEYRVAEAIRGLEGFDYLWIIWEFSESKGKPWSPTVRPPMLGGNKRIGVFATRSPFRPNPIGLSSVKIKSIEKDEKLGYVIKVTGADIMNGTPVYDIKPYIAYADSHPDASGGFTESCKPSNKKVSVAEGIILPENKADEIISVLSCDPRPRYIDDETREYGITLAGYNIRFTVKSNDILIKEISSIEKE